jgi:hypothetical protein
LKNLIEIVEILILEDELHDEDLPTDDPIIVQVAQLMKK